MYEFEVDFQSIEKESIPAEIKNAFIKSNNELAEADCISPILWEEHCTECAMPKCYTTCELYQPRKDGKCRRFKNGISKIKLKDSLLGYIVKIEFKQWASLMATSKVIIGPVSEVIKIEKQLNNIENLARNTPDGWLSIAGRSGLSSRMARRYKRQQITKFEKSSLTKDKPTHFIIETYNHDEITADVTFTIRAESGPKKAFPYQKRLKLTKGFHRESISYDEIIDHIEDDLIHYISIIPNNDSAINLYFGYLGFISYPGHDQSTGKIKDVKVVVWDLDHTMWDGILVEQTEEKPVTLKSGISHIISELDRRGIVNSIISKNDHELAMIKLKEFGIDEYFVFPEISWNPKSIAMSNIIKNFNVSADTIVFIDDSKFEREEVSSQHPLIRTIDAIEYNQILNKDEFNPRTSTESSSRRKFYNNQKNRSDASSSFRGEYLEFVKNCEIQLIISPGKTENIDRIQELVQRTNQMNFSGNRYSKQELSNILESNCFDTYQLKCNDKFGDYGTVGFCVVDKEQQIIIDLAFSCRVQSKRVEHAFILWLAKKSKTEGHDKFSAIYNQTDKNSQSGKVFTDLGFIKESDNFYSYPLNIDIEDDGIINITNDESN
jgi:FkbH-like protein